MYEETENISFDLIGYESSLSAEISLFLFNAEPRLFWVSQGLWNKHAPLKNKRHQLSFNPFSANPTKWPNTLK